MLNTLLLRYKNILVSLAVFFAVVMILSKLLAFFDRRIEDHDLSIVEGGKKIELAQQAAGLEQSVAQLRGKFIDSPDLFAFMNMISRQAKSAGFSYVNITPMMNAPSAFNVREDSPVVPVAAKLAVRGSFQQLGDFIEQLDTQELRILVWTMRVGREEDLLSAEFEIVGLALAER
ncbi:hypothetical protein ACFL5X_04080 [Candidatus Omnitrophota bacterium]